MISSELVKEHYSQRRTIRMSRETRKCIAVGQPAAQQQERTTVVAEPVRREISGALLPVMSFKYSSRFIAEPCGAFASSITRSGRAVSYSRTSSSVIVAKRE